MWKECNLWYIPWLSWLRRDRTFSLKILLSLQQLPILYALLADLVHIGNDIMKSPEWMHMRMQPKLGEYSLNTSRSGPNWFSSFCILQLFSRPGRHSTCEMYIERTTECHPPSFLPLCPPSSPSLPPLAPKSELIFLGTFKPSQNQPKLRSSGFFQSHFLSWWDEKN